ncbi:MAG: RHS repeat domain-containing protein, partial [Bradyrhizobium sp.]
YTYDELGRLASRTVAGAGAGSFGYDAIGRLTSHTSDLGAFTLGYLGGRCLRLVDIDRLAYCSVASRPRSDQ